MNVALFHIFWIHEEEATFVSDATISVVESVDRRIELVVTTDGHEHEFVVFDLGGTERIHGKDGLTGSGFELALLGGVGEVEAPGLADAGVEVLEAGDGFFDQVPDAVVVFGHVSEVDSGTFAECGGGEAGGDLGFAEEIVRDRFEITLALVDDAHGILHGGELGLAFVVEVLFAAAEAG